MCVSNCLDTFQMHHCSMAAAKGLKACRTSGAALHAGSSRKLGAFTAEVSPTEGIEIEHETDFGLRNFSFSSPSLLGFCLLLPAFTLFYFLLPSFLPLTFSFLSLSFFPLSFLCFSPGKFLEKHQMMLSVPRNKEK